MTLGRLIGGDSVEAYSVSESHALVADDAQQTTDSAGVVAMIHDQTSPRNAVRRHATALRDATAHGAAVTLRLGHRVELGERDTERSAQTPITLGELLLSGLTRNGNCYALNLTAILALAVSAFLLTVAHAAFPLVLLRLNPQVLFVEFVAASTVLGWFPRVLVPPGAGATLLFKIHSRIVPAIPAEALR